MCGIVGYVGNTGAIDVLINGLKRLEYRGYDSAGVALIENKAIHLCKDRGKVLNLEQQVHTKWDEAFCKNTGLGIAHTRWATHGSPTAAAQRYYKARDFFFLGRGCLYPVALEGALKLKEISYIHAEGYHAAELKHGPIALLDAEVPVLAM